jgi:hypothetical protein
MAEVSWTGKEELAPSWGISPPSYPNQSDPLLSHSAGRDSIFQDWKARFRAMKGIRAAHISESDYPSWIDFDICCPLVWTPMKSRDRVTQTWLLTSHHVVYQFRAGASLECMITSTVADVVDNVEMTAVAWLREGKHGSRRGGKKGCEGGKRGENDMWKVVW